MEIQLINGTFEVKDAEQILRDIFKVKTLFHENKINTNAQSEEDIKHAEKRIRQLQESLRTLLESIHQNGQSRVSIQAHIELTTREKMHQ